MLLYHIGNGRCLLQLLLGPLFKRSLKAERSGLLACQPLPMIQSFLLSALPLLRSRFQQPPPGSQLSLPIQYYSAARAAFFIEDALLLRQCLMQFLNFLLLHDHTLFQLFHLAQHSLTALGQLASHTRKSFLLFLSDFLLFFEGNVNVFFSANGFSALSS